MSVNRKKYCFIDSNIWLYRFIFDPQNSSSIEKQKIATKITNNTSITISTQIINEVCFNLIRKANFSNLEIQNLIKEFQLGCRITPVCFDTVEYAGELRNNYSLSFWDSLIVASAILGEATIIYSEDMQDNLVIENKIQVINPFRLEL